MGRFQKMNKQRQQQHQEQQQQHEENGNTANTTTTTMLSSHRQAGLFVLFMASLTLYHGSAYTSTTLDAMYKDSRFVSSSSTSSSTSRGDERSLRTRQPETTDNEQNFTTVYEPAEIETWLIGPEKNGRKFNFHHSTRIRKQMADGCKLYLNESVSPFYDRLQQFRAEIHDYTTILDNFLLKNDGSDMAVSTTATRRDSASPTSTATARRRRLTDQTHLPEPKLQPVADLRKQIKADGGSHEICDTLELHPDGLPGIFGKSQMLSKVPNGGGYVEPLLTPLRHLEHCYANHPFNSSYVMDMHYLVHDFASLCRKLTPSSRTVFVDMGASLDFHDKTKDPAKSGIGSKLAPAVFVTEVYQKFGFKFDHIYAYEVTPKEPSDVYRRIPDDLKAAYHWYNVGVDAAITASNNPLKLLLENFDENDFVVVKLDIDTHSIEQPMVELILNDERFHSIIDCFYFEHHVHLLELAPYWRSGMAGTVEDSLQLFSKLRERGVAAHYWP
mmetsp:Transcript_10231/g.24591  ORF Transcript_10231/g.24591 Transcript_10231/m.24591 type:complete len:500 (+) Transcript_10231:132-1631(+)